MPHVRGLLVRLKTSPQSGSGTNDPMYVGVVDSQSRGREFPLFVDDFNDYKEGDDVTYRIGKVAPIPVEPTMMVPVNSDVDEANDPDLIIEALGGINFNDVRQVYLRKTSNAPDGSDNPYQLSHIEVTLVDGFNQRTYRGPTTNESATRWLGDRFGHQVWLTP